MIKDIDPVFAYCQFCKEKREMTQDYIISTGKIRTLRGLCKSCKKSMQLVIKKGYKLP